MSDEELVLEHVSALRGRGRPVRGVTEAGLRSAGEAVAAEQAALREWQRQQASQAWK